MVNLNVSKNFLFRVSTPYSLGIGFKVKGFDWIITNENLVRGNHSVVVENLFGDIDYAKIIYIDPLLDVAVLKLPFEDIEGGFELSDQISLVLIQLEPLLSLELLVLLLSSPPSFQLVLEFSPDST